MKKSNFLIICLLFIANTIFGQSLNVMPLPSKTEMGNQKLRITSKFNIQLTALSTDKVIEAASNRLLQRLNKRTLAYFEEEQVVLNESKTNPTLTIEVKNKVEPTQIGVDESYLLTVDDKSIQLKADNTLGALRGIETLLQLTNSDEIGYYFPEVKIADTPRFKWRGMMVDVARHFIPIDILKRNIDAMAMVKLNVLHLHLSDDEGFRVESKVYPKLHELGSNGQFYSQSELKSLINYASGRGIMVYPEFDLPGHSTSWFAGYPELASKEAIYKPGHRFKIKEGTPISEAVGVIMKSATPTLNPTKEATYKFLEKFVAEMAALFPSPYFHIGADENNGAAWLENPQIAKFMTEKGMKEPQQLQAYFVKRMYEILKKNKKTTIGWEELFDTQLPKDVVVQIWGAIGEKRPKPAQMIEQGNNILISKGFYLDYFLPAYIHYANPHIPAEANANILGGEAALWSELVDENSFEGRAWLRTATVAERLWSPESVKDIDDMYRRLYILSDQLEENGLNHRLNSIRMLSTLSSGQDVQNPLLILETLAPARGYGRLLSSFTAAERTKFQQVPLVDLRDLVGCDSEAAWWFRKEVEKYLVSKNELSKSNIIRKLSEWQNAAKEIPVMMQKAPNLNELNEYAQRVSLAAEIGQKTLLKAPTETEKAEFLNALKGMKVRGDRLEILILSEIEALVTGTIKPLPKGF